MYDFDIPLQAVSGTIVRGSTHDNTDFDEIFAAWQISRKATADWVENWTDNGRVQLGVGPDGQKGVINEHAARDTRGDKSQSCASLTAMTLKIRDDRFISPLVDKATLEDAEGVSEPDNVFKLIKSWRTLRPRQEAQMFAWTWLALDAWLAAAQKRWEEWNTLPVQTRDAYWHEFVEHGGMGLNFFNLESSVRELCTARNDLDTFLKWQEVLYSVKTESSVKIAEATAEAIDRSIVDTVRTKTGLVRIATIMSDNAFILAGCYRAKLNVGVILLVKSSGNFQIFGSKGRITLKGVMGRLAYTYLRNKKELSKENEEKPIDVAVKSVRDNMVRGGKQLWTDRLYYFTAGGMIFNGSQTAVVEPLIGHGLTVQEIRDCIMKGIPDEIGVPDKSTRPKSDPPKPEAPATPTPAAPATPPTPETPEPAK